MGARGEEACLSGFATHALEASRGEGDGNWKWDHWCTAVPLQNLRRWQASSKLDGTTVMFYLFICCSFKNQPKNKMMLSHKHNDR